jgi:hypothetical protein
MRGRPATPPILDGTAWAWRLRAGRPRPWRLGALHLARPASAVRPGPCWWWLAGANGWVMWGAWCEWVGHVGCGRRGSGRRRRPGTGARLRRWRSGRRCRRTCRTERPAPSSSRCPPAPRGMGKRTWRALVPARPATG